MTDTIDDLGHTSSEKPAALVLLLGASLVSDTQADEAMVAAPENPVRWLTTQGIVKTTDLVRLAAEAEGRTFVDLTDVYIEPEVLAHVPARTARQFNVLPVGYGPDGTLQIAAAPDRVNDPHLRDDISSNMKTAVPFELVVALGGLIQQRLGTLYRAEEEISGLAVEIAKSAQEERPQSAVAELTEATDRSPIVGIVDLLINQAIDDGASDIHIDPEERFIRVRYRVDAVLRIVNELPIDTKDEIVARIKIMASLDPSIRQTPQDGRISVVNKGKPIDLRVAILPCQHGEKVVMRVLDNSNTLLSLSDLGFSPGNVEIFKRAYTKPYGAILVTGPTGSGKSTTLYATLNQVSRPEINVITVENPVEYTIGGITQVEVNPKRGMTFEAALRSILRADPDVILIGEIRDHETAQIAMEASLTGHLVMSTLHTNDAPSAITRLTEMGIEPFLVGSAVDLVAAQRLCRRLCKQCKEAYVPDAETLAALDFPFEDGNLPTLFKPVGCRYCGESGYKGRMGLHELMEVDATVERMTVEGKPLEEITEYAIANTGMTLLRQDGWWKVRQGLTSIEEVLRVVV